MGRFINGWTLIAILLVAIIIAGGVIIWSRYSRSQPIEISIIPDRELRGKIYVGGKVNSPGIYPLEAGDSIEDVLRAAGGITDGADLNRIEIMFLGSDRAEIPQKININRAEIWLLSALPGIGEVRSQAIVEYRQKNGPFSATNELLKVEGMGYATYEKVKHLITVAD